jgi:hypothetical protein
MPSSNPPLHNANPSRNTVPQRRRIKIDKPSHSASVSKTDPTNCVAFYFGELSVLVPGTYRCAKQGLRLTASPTVRAQWDVFG